MFDLIVRHAFAGYNVGDRITDRAEVEKYQDSPFVTRVPADPAYPQVQ